MTRFGVSEAIFRCHKRERLIMECFNYNELNMQLQVNSVNDTSTSLIQNVWCPVPLRAAAEKVDPGVG